MGLMTEEARKYSRSVSQLKSYTKCGEAFRLSRMVRPRLPRRPAAWTCLGIAFHEVFEKWEREQRSFNPVSEFADIYDRVVTEEKLRQPDLSLWQKAPRTKTVEADIDNYRKRGIERDVPKYWSRRLEAEWSILELPDGEPCLELEFEIDLGGIPVKGAVDLVQWWPSLNAAAVEDTKTGSADDEEDARQLALYRVALAEVYDIDLVYGRYWFTKLDRGSDWVDLRKYSKTYLAEQYYLLNEGISSGLFLPNPGKKCGLCDVRPWCRELGWLKEGEEL